MLSFLFPVSDNKNKDPIELFVINPPTIAVTGRQNIAVYELHVKNNSTKNISLISLEITGGKVFKQLKTFDSSDLKKMTYGRNASGKKSDPGQAISSGITIIYLEIEIVDARYTEELFHTLIYSKAEDKTKKTYPVSLRTNIINREPLVLGSPLKAGPWAAIYSADWERGHRRVIYTIDGHPYIPGRFAIDFVRLDSLGRFAKGNDDTVSNWYGHALEVFAVHDGIIASTRTDFPETTTLSAHPQYDSSKATGNYISLDIGNNRYAFYEHLKPGSIRVKPGQRVKKGDTIALLGFTGQSTGPHLHFHVANKNSPLGAEGVPYSFEEFTLVGIYNDFSKFGKEAWNTREAGIIRIKRELPGSNSVIKFD
jgi:hypothetical protein